jgi:glycosyltransferase involved in cell wall biosynthesis
MRLAFIADGRSPHTRGWLRLFTQGGHEVHLVSTFRCVPLSGLASYRFIPVAFSAGARGASAGQAPGGAAAIGLRSAVRHWLGPITLPLAARKLRFELESIRPDVVHALRIPFEGMLAAAADKEWPLVVSVWGNDFTLHAGAAPGMSVLTRRTLQAAGGLHADCHRDVHLAHEWGYPEDRPSIVLPGGGGIDRSIFHPGDTGLKSIAAPVREILAGIPHEAPVVVNPRGFRAYIRNDTFFRAIPEILSRMPGSIFLCPSMAGEAQAERWLEELGIGDNVLLLPELPARAMAAVYQRSWVMVSPSIHDGTPNSFLEAIACGCFPVVADLDSLREWIEDESNGILTSAADPEHLADSVVHALQDGTLREQASQRNQALIEKRASRDVGIRLALALYEEVAGRPGIRMEGELH